MHVTELPSPSFQTTLLGRATASTETPGTAAVADTRRQAPRASHNQVGKFTSCSLAGFVLICGAGSRSWLRACCATCAGDGAGAPPPSSCVASGIHTGGR
ncbi:hypothetical protein [Streptomyces lasiicapitis]|uniref:hypothetical protein n=1 Tax=Streptomyces lasiicapitis TaxID=1923961 RepID=UPI00365AB007